MPVNSLLCLFYFILEKTFLAQLQPTTKRLKIHLNQVITKDFRKNVLEFLINYKIPSTNSFERNTHTHRL